MNESKGVIQNWVAFQIKDDYLPVIITIMKCGFSIKETCGLLRGYRLKSVVSIKLLTLTAITMIAIQDKNTKNIIKS